MQKEIDNKRRNSEQVTSGAAAAADYMSLYWNENNKSENEYEIVDDGGKYAAIRLFRSGLPGTKISKELIFMLNLSLIDSCLDAANSARNRLTKKKGVKQ
jgi:hypothetical protein